ncbi:MAG: 30S ribosomal protein S17 [Candidatus Aenigmarchaeota archaeon]|nr:30S ribosomal protein S17 [Candidatus Aenigmarchaeota archaeon]
MKARNIGIDVKPPEKTCEDVNCPFHGTLGVRGNLIQGKVVSTRAQKTAVIEKNYQHYLPKYERFERRHSRIVAYNPECVGAKEGNVVSIAECRPLSKTKAFVVIEKVK